MASVRDGDSAMMRVSRAPGLAAVTNKSSSMVSDCYSSDEDCTDNCRDGLLNWSSHQSSVVILREGVAHNGDQRCSGGPSILRVREKHRRARRHLPRETGDDPSATLTSQCVCTSGSDATHVNASGKWQSPDKNLVEFYRPPSGSRMRCFNEVLDQDENASTVALHYSESHATACLPVGYVSKLLADSGDRRDIDLSGSLFNSRQLVPDPLVIESVDPALALFSGVGALGSRAQSEVAIRMGRQSRRHDFTTDCSRACSPDFIHSVSCRIPLTNPAIKSTSAQFSSPGLHEHAIQASPTDKMEAMVANPVPCEPGRTLENKAIIGHRNQRAQNRNVEDGDSHRSLYQAVELMQDQVDRICRVRDNWAIRDPLAIGQDSSDETYPSQAVLDLHQRIKEWDKQLNCQLAPEAVREKPSKHQRHFSEVPRNRSQLFGTGDFPHNSEEADPGPSQSHDNKVVLLHPVEAREMTCRVFELSPYDDLVRSYRSSTDRRIKAVGNKMKCAILIEGPLQMFDSTSTCWNMRSKIAYRCSISGTSKEVVEKCLKCLQDTFPQSCLNEKHVGGKPNRKQTFSSLASPEQQ